MQYDFDTILDRRGRDALALDMIPYDGVEPSDFGFVRKQTAAAAQTITDARTIQNAGFL